jgi:hypothetical protein
VKSNTEFWNHVDLALDERRDPLEDGALQDAIAGDPELLDQLLALRSRLAALPRTPERSRLPRLAVAAAIAIALGAIAFELLRFRSTAAEPRLQIANTSLGPAAQAGRSPDAPLAKSEIIDFELSITTERPGERDTVVIDRSGTRRTRELVGDAREHSTLTTEVLNPRGL